MVKWWKFTTAVCAKFKYY